jgi:hypothetical protein
MRTWLDCLVVLIVGAGSFVFLSARTQRGARMEISGRVQKPIAAGDLAPALGEAEAKLETSALGLGTNGVYRFRSRHPWLYAWVRSSPEARWRLCS